MSQQAPVDGRGTWSAVMITGRDEELLGHLAAGRSTREAAAAMSVSTNTLRTRLHRLQDKLQVTGREQVLRRSRELRLV